MPRFACEVLFREVSDPRGLLGRVLNVEVKCRSKLQFYSWLGSADLLLVKADRYAPLAVLPLPLLVELMLAAERGAKASAADDTRFAP
jgi:hypothetical protein